MKRAAVVALIAGCATGVPARDGDGGFEEEVKGGRLHARRVQQIELAAAAAELDGVIGEEEMTVTRTAESRDAGGARLVHMTARQEIDGVPVHGTYLGLTFREGAERVLVGSAYHVFRAPRVDMNVALGEDAAAEAAREVLRADAGRPARVTMEVWPLDDQLALVWVVDVEGVAVRALVRATGPRAGEVVVRDERRYAGGVVRGVAAVGGAPGGAGEAEVLPMADIEVVGGGQRAWTDVTGRFELDVATGTPIAVGLRGRAADVRDAAGHPVTASGRAGSGVALQLGGATEGALAQVTAYRAITATRAFLIAAGFDAEDLPPVVAKVNVAGSCNAYFDPETRRLELVRAGDGCRNSAEDSIVAHEYGHFVDDAYGGILDDGLSEGWGDALACLSRGAPAIGPDLMDGGPLRSCDNHYRYPPSGHDEMHDLGQAWAGFVWDVRARLGEDLVLALVLPSLTSNAPDIPSAVREVFLRDDDDGDLGNRTPHWDSLWAAAERHGLTFALEGDATPPRRVIDLAVADLRATAATVRWTAPGDDGARGTAAAYDLRIAGAPITDATFAQATRVAAPDPVAGGSVQEAVVPVVPGGGPLWVALRAADEAGNLSTVSVAVRVEPAPVDVVFDDGAEHGLGRWAVTGLWHVTARRANDGSHAFWYGDEAHASYQTGSRTAGTLTSPVIDLAGVDRPALVLAEWLEVELAPQFDIPTLTVRDVDDPAIAVTLGKDGGTTAGAFRTRVLDLAPLTGRRVQIVFAFDSIDGRANRGEGWFVDDVRVVGARGEPAAPALVINEILADPPAGYVEFLELVNAGDQPLDVGGWTIADAIRTRRTLPPATTIAPGKALLIQDGLYLNNDGDTVHVRRPSGEVVAEISYGTEGGHDTSLVRQSDGDGASPFVAHQALAGTPASPGTRSDGSPF